jgi:nucleoid DNA-binding protein
MAKKKATRKKAAKKKTTKKATKKATAKKKTKKTTKKATKKKTTAKKTTAKKTTRSASRTFDKVSKPRTKSQILTAIADHTGLSKKDVGGVFDSLSELIGQDLKKGPGTFTVPGLMKVVVVRKPAVKARKGINPFTGEEMMFKAKPARNVVKVRPLKGLKDKV